MKQWLGRAWLGTGIVGRYGPDYVTSAKAINPMLVDPELIERLVESMRLAGSPE